MSRVQVKTTVHGVFRANLPGRCIECKTEIRPGDLIGFVRGYVGCRQCKEGIRERKEAYL